jgi:hypothetical protein
MYICSPTLFVEKFLQTELLTLSFVYSCIKLYLNEVFINISINFDSTTNTIQLRKSIYLS